MEDCGKTLNEEIAKLKQRVNDLRDKLYRAECELETLKEEKKEAQQECQHCNDCSMCLG